MPQDKFVAYHRERHAPPSCELPEVRQHVRRYVQWHTVPGSIPGLPPITFDGITELWFDDGAGLAAVFASERYMGEIRPDEARFSWTCKPAMTRTRARADGVPTDLMRDYYVQRASAGLIVTECVTA